MERGPFFTLEDQKFKMKLGWTGINEIQTKNVLVELCQVFAPNGDLIFLLFHD